MGIKGIETLEVQEVESLHLAKTILNAIASIKDKNKHDYIFELVMDKYYIQAVINSYQTESDASNCKSS